MSRTKAAARKSGSRYSTNVDRHSNSRQSVDPTILNAAKSSQINNHSSMSNSESGQGGVDMTQRKSRPDQVVRRLSSRSTQNSHTSPTRSGRGKKAISDTPQMKFSQQSGRKRKASHEPIDEPASRRAKVDDEEHFIDEAYVRRTMDYPTTAQYPHAPPQLFGEHFIAALHDIGANALQLRQNIVPSKHIYRSGNAVFVCTTRCRLPSGESLAVDGHGVSKRDAARAAYVHLLAMLHKKEVLRDLFPPPEQTFDKQMLREERDAKFDVYNYAARFGYIPEFSERTVNRHGGVSKRGRLLAGGKLVEVTIEVKEQGIKTSGRGNILDNAEIAASIRFKEEAEKYHAEHGDETIVIKDSTALNTGNAKLFFDFYKLEHKNSVVEVQTKPIKGDVKTGGSLFSSQVTIDKEPIGVPVTSKSRKTTEELAHLVAAVTLTQKDAEMFQEFQSALAAGGGTAILTPLKPIDMELHEDTVHLMQQTLADAKQLGMPKSKEAIEPESHKDSHQYRARQRLTEDALVERHKTLLARQAAFRADPQLRGMRDLRESLPMSQYSQKVLELVNNNVYSIIIGATGSGKTTQVPQILLDEAISNGVGGKCDVICTQPRRIAATSVARRVANERNEILQESVGYHVRFDPKNASLGGSINFCTTGILLQQLQRAPDEIFDTVSHIVVDEVHERDILIDFLMILLKKTVSTRIKAGKPVPKIILMSATIDSELFAKYFAMTTKDGKKLACPSLSVPGRTFPVKERYFETIVKELEEKHGSDVVKSLSYGFAKGSKNTSLPSDEDTRLYMSGENNFKALPSSGHASQDDEAEATIDWKRERTLTGDGQVANEKEDSLVPVPLIATTIAHIAKTSTDGAILVFLPGYDEIKKTRQYLEESSPLGVNFRDPAKFKLSMLHSTVPAAEQAEVFEPVPEGCRKVILSTNIAETSVTIPDIQYVVDTGKLREKRYDQIRRITKLQCTWISKSNAKQRAGRAGRVQNGNYYALYSKARYESLRSVGLPEMLRSDLQEICLDIKAQAFNTPIREFLAQAIEPPSPVAVDSSVLNLVALEALTEDENLTALGRVLASLPVHPTLGKMIVLGIIFRCLDPMIILGAALNERSPFVSPPDKRIQAGEMHRRFLEGSGSDHIALINAVRQTRFIGDTRGPGAMNSFAMEHFVHLGAFKTINATSKQIEEILVESGLIPYTAPRDRFDGELGHPTLNKNANNITLLKAIALAGTHPNLAVCKGISFRTPGEKAAMIHPSSLNHLKPGKNAHVYPIGTLFSYSTMQKSNDGNQMNLRETTATTPLMAALFGGKLKSSNNIVSMDAWLPFYVKSSTWRSTSTLVSTILKFREALDIILGAAYASINPKVRAHTSVDKDKTHAYLADDPVREIFASGLVDVLDKDGTTAEASIARPAIARPSAARTMPLKSNYRLGPKLTWMSNSEVGGVVSGRQRPNTGGRFRG